MGITDAMGLLCIIEELGVDWFKNIDDRKVDMCVRIADRRLLMHNGILTNLATRTRTVIKPTDDLTSVFMFVEKSVFDARVLYRKRDKSVPEE